MMVARAFKFGRTILLIAKMIMTQKFDRDESRSSSKPINSEEVRGKVDRDESCDDGRTTSQDRSRR